MKLYSVISLVLLLTMLFVPLFSLLGSEKTENVMSEKILTTQAEKENKAEKTEKKEAAGEKEKMRVLRVSTGKVEETDLREYVICCVSSEMLPTYEKEALKAQAVVSYTYALYFLNNPYSDSADVTDSSSVHQAYRSREEIKEKWGEKYDSYIKNIEKAVDETAGEYLTYSGEIIKPAYHAMSSGRTSSALDVWGNDVPYLQSVTSDGDRLSPKFISTYDFTEEELSRILSECAGKKIKEITIGDAVTNSGGYVKKIEISGETFTGEAVRKALSLRSGAFTVSRKDDTFTFTCTGYGHGVGMSQNGAQYMAQNGSTCDEILHHYYTGVEIKS